MSWLPLARTDAGAVRGDVDASHAVAVAPSLLACDWTRLVEEVAAVERAGAEFLHLDVMDGHFVPNLTFGPLLVAAIERVATLTLDTHLMIESPSRYLEAFARAGSDILTIHVEAEGVDVRRDLRAIRALGVKAGLAFNPDRTIADVEPYLDEIDLLLVMSVFPGFGGQEFMAGVLPHLERAAELRARRGLEFAIEIDGGLNPETAARARGAGADILVAGTSVFRAGDYAAEIAALRGDGASFPA